jgi:membrane protease YdiL (CAAX protease family)
MKEEQTPIAAFPAKGIFKGIFLLVMYLAVFPVLTGLLVAGASAWMNWEISEKAQLLIPYYASFLLTIVLFKDFLIDNLRVFFFRFGRSLGSMFLSYLLSYVMTIVVVAVLAAAAGTSDNPNDIAMGLLVEMYDKPMVVIAVFLAPLIEETLFRGVIFGTIWNKNRFLGYLISWLLFGAAHLVQYAVMYGDWKIMTLLIEYLPPSIAWAFCYRRSGSIWAPVFMHMIFNGIGIWALANMT